MLIRDGNTHYPAEQQEWRFFKGALDIPPFFIVIDGSGEITLDAIDWMSMQGTPLIRLRWDGQFASIVTAGGQAASTECVLWQKSLREHPEKRLAFAIDLIRRKVENTTVTLESHVPRSRIWNRAYKNVSVRAEWLGKRPPKTLEELLGIEGSVANDYFRAWSGIPLKWKVAKRYPIPEDWQTYTSRAANRVGTRQNYRATHPINAMLNYAYGVITARAHVQLIADGYDPAIGVLHDNRARRGAYPPFALDHIEPLRPIADRAILQIITSETLTGADFSVQDDGVCRLNPELARRVAKLTTEISASSGSKVVTLSETKDG
ncbi:MAG: CRISPR-associated endonuclease Cas1 [Pseudomonadales bacterium]